MVKKKKKKVIWFIGSNASGKTTQAKMIHNKLGTKPKEIIQKKKDGKYKFRYTDFGKVVHVGAIGDNQCTGTDTLPNKAAVEKSYKKCIKSKARYIILDPIMSTGKYIELLRKYDVELYLVYIHFDTPADNLKRVALRNYKKYRDKSKSVDYKAMSKSEQHGEKTVQNITNKQKGFHSLYKRVKGEVDHHIFINADLPKSIIHKGIMEFIK